MKLIDRLNPEKISASYLQRILWEYGIDPMGLNRHFIIDAVAQIIVAEIDSVTHGDAILEKLREINKIAA